MTDMTKLTQALEERGFTVKYFTTSAQAVDWLDGEIDGKSVALGGSTTLKDIGLYPRLSSHNRCIWHWEGGSVHDAMDTDVYLSSANALAETGEIINIDGRGNRVASTIYGHKEVFFVVGSNKIAPDFESALWRARNVAAPRRAQSSNKKTPCAVKADRCYDCKSSERICRALAVLWNRPSSVKRMVVVLVDEELGF